MQGLGWGFTFPAPGRTWSPCAAGGAELGRAAQPEAWGIFSVGGSDLFSQVQAGEDIHA